MEVQQEIDSKSDLEAQVRLFYHNLLRCWNSYDANEFASLFTAEGNLVGYDGSQINGRQEIRTHLRGIFDHHQPPSIISIIREVRPICSGAFILRAVAGMVPPGQGDINPISTPFRPLSPAKKRMVSVRPFFKRRRLPFTEDPSSWKN